MFTSPPQVPIRALYTGELGHVLFMLGTKMAEHPLFKHCVPPFLFLIVNNAYCVTIVFREFEHCFPPFSFQIANSTCPNPPILRALVPMRCGRKLSTSALLYDRGLSLLQTRWAQANDIMGSTKWGVMLKAKAFDDVHVYRSSV